MSCAGPPCKETTRLSLRQFENPETYSLGWNFNNKFYGKGYAKESAYAFIELLFDAENVRRIYAYNEDGTRIYEDTMQYASIFRAVLILIIRLLQNW